MVSGRLARSRDSVPGGPEIVNEKSDEELIKEMGLSWTLDGFQMVKCIGKKKIDYEGVLATWGRALKS